VKHFILGAGAVAAIAGVAYAQTPADRIHARQANYKQIASALKGINDELHGGNPDIAAIRPRAALIANYAVRVLSWFPRGTGTEAGVRTRARPEIWSDRRSRGAGRQCRRGPRGGSGAEPCLQRLPRKLPGARKLMRVPRVRIWDLPVRIFHWAIVLLVPALWATNKLDRMDLHILLGETMLGLVLFRLIWGVAGSSTARFAGFVRGPRALHRYLRGRSGPVFGHNPVGGWSVVLMLLVLATQVGLGLFAIDEDSLNEGPLSHLVSYDTARTLAHRHETVFYVLLALIALHVAAILYYLIVKRDDLVTPMLTGRRAKGGDGAALVPAPLWRFLISAVLAVGLTLALVKFL
jgi:cytochrome b/cytochrome c556